MNSAHYQQLLNQSDLTDSSYEFVTESLKEPESFGQSCTQAKAHHQNDGWKFTFIGGQSSKNDCHRDSNHDSQILRDKSIRLLSTIEVGKQVQIVECNNKELSQSLAQIDLSNTATVRVESRRESGSVLLDIQGHRLGVGAAIAKQIKVKTLDDS